MLSQAMTTLWSARIFSHLVRDPLTFTRLKYVTGTSFRSGIFHLPLRKPKLIAFAVAQEPDPDTARNIAWNLLHISPGYSNSMERIKKRELI